MVLFSLRDGISDSERDALFVRIRDLGNIPSVRRIETGLLLDPREPGYRGHMSSDFSCALLADFDDEDGLYAYQKDPSHVLVAKEIRERVSLVKVMDFVVSA
jgi:hypothetical protein